MSLADKVQMVHGGSSNTDSQGAAGYVPSIPKLCIPELVFQDAGAGVGDGQTEHDGISGSDRSSGNVGSFAAEEIRPGIGLGSAGARERTSCSRPT